MAMVGRLIKAVSIGGCSVDGVGLLDTLACCLVRSIASAETPYK